MYWTLSEPSTRSSPWFSMTMTHTWLKAGRAPVAVGDAATDAVGPGVLASAVGDTVGVETLATGEPGDVAAGVPGERVTMTTNTATRTTTAMPATSPTTVRSLPERRRGSPGPFSVVDRPRRACRTRPGSGPGRGAR